MQERLKLEHLGLSKSKLSGELEVKLPKIFKLDMDKVRQGDVLENICKVFEGMQMTATGEHSIKGMEDLFTEVK